MKRYHFCITVIVLSLLAACGTSVNETDRHFPNRSPFNQQSIEPSSLELSSRFTMKEDDFIYTLFSKQEIYEANEETAIFAELTYVGEQETIEIAHGDPLIAFSLHENSRNVTIDMLFREIAETSTLTKNEPILVKFDITKNFMSASDEKSQQFYNAAKQNGLPAGDYLIKSSAQFFVKEGKHYNLTGAIKFSIKK